MKGEKVLYASDSELAREGISQILEKHASSDGHSLVETVGSLTELRRVLNEGAAPTVFLFDPRFPTLATGKKAARLVKKLSPDTVVVTLPSYGDLELVDYCLERGIGVQELVSFFTNLEHS
jgi:DNA-binding NarL/FixJ family response regulator